MINIDMEAFATRAKGEVQEYNKSVLCDLEKVKLNTLFRKKNTLLGASEPIETASDYAKWCLDNWLASSKESKFGLVLETLARYIALTYRKISTRNLTGLDLIIESDDYIDLVQVKSGPNWGNADQIRGMVQNMQEAYKIVHDDLNGRECRFINLVCYGKDGPSQKKEYIKFCGQECWEYLTDDPDFYLKLIEPIRAARDAVAFEAGYSKTLNLLTKKACEEFVLPDGSMNWGALQRMNSGKKAKKLPKKTGKKKNP